MHGEGIFVLFNWYTILFLSYCYYFLCDFVCTISCLENKYDNDNDYLLTTFREDQIFILMQPQTFK